MLPTQHDGPCTIKTRRDWLTLRMQSPPFAVQISLESWLFEAHLKDWHTLHARVLSDFRIVLMYDTVESGRMQGIMSCVVG